MKAAWWKPNSSIEKSSEFTWVLPQMRINISTVWDLARRMGEIAGEPARVLDADLRPIERGREAELSDSQLAGVVVTTHPEPRPDGSARPFRNGIVLVATLAVRGGTLQVGGDETVARQRREQAEELANWLVGESRYRWGRGPGAFTPLALVAVGLAICALEAGGAALRAGQGLVLIPLLVAGMAAIVRVFGAWAWGLAKEQAVLSRGQLVDPRPREQIALQRENRRATWRDRVEGWVFGLVTGGVVWGVAQLWQRWF